MPKAHKIMVRVNVGMSEEAIQTIVQLAKAEVGPDHRGVYHVDTADKVGMVVTEFLEAKDFDAYLRGLATTPKASE
jgi:hypothetical protein